MGALMPAKAGIQVRSRFKLKKNWIPASAGMTEMRGIF
jgi:hypothetical protein